ALEEAGLLDETDPVPVGIVQEGVARTPGKNVRPVDRDVLRSYTRDLVLEGAGLEPDELPAIDHRRRPAVEDELERPRAARGPDVDDVPGAHADLVRLLEAEDAHVEGERLLHVGRPARDQVEVHYWIDERLLQS